MLTQILVQFNYKFLEKCTFPFLNGSRVKSLVIIIVIVTYYAIFLLLLQEIYYWNAAAIRNGGPDECWYVGDNCMSHPVIFVPMDRMHWDCLYDIWVYKLDHCLIVCRFVGDSILSWRYRYDLGEKRRFGAQGDKIRGVAV